MIVIHWEEDRAVFVGGIATSKSVIADTLYAVGDLAPNYPMPATLKASVSNLSVRWSNWMD